MVNLLIPKWHGAYDFKVVPFSAVRRGAHYLFTAFEDGAMWDCYEGTDGTLYAVSC